MKKLLFLLASLSLVSACENDAHFILPGDPDEVPEKCLEYVENAYNQGYEDGVASVPVCAPTEVECPVCPPPVTPPPTTCGTPVDGDFVITATARAVKRAQRECRPQEETWFKEGTFKWEKHGSCTYEINEVTNHGCRWNVKATCKSGKTYHFVGDLALVGGKEVFGGTLQIQNPYCEGGACDVTYDVGITRWYYSVEPTPEVE